MHALAYPVAFGHWHIQSNRLVCRLPRKVVAVTAPASLLASVMALCDGRMAWRQVAAQLGRRWSGPNVETFLAHLCAQGLLVEACESLAGWTDLGQLPMLYPRVAPPQELPLLHQAAQSRLLAGAGSCSPPADSPAGTLAQVLRQRESHRTFADAPLPARTLATIVWAAHGVARAAGDSELRWHRTVGSGGNLHAARWFALVLRALPGGRNAPALAAGLYEARFHVEGGASFEPLETSADAAWRVLSDPRVLAFASALVLPVHEISRAARKYGNRATVFAQVEAGQSLQNAQLMATALGAGAMVRGDTSAAEVMTLLQATLGGKGRRNSRWLAMPALLLGARPTREQVALQQQDDWIQVGAVSAAVSPGGTADRPFAFFAGPVQEGGSQLYASGRSADPRLALAKAEAEAWERQGWAHLGSDVVVGRIGEVAGAIDPRRVVAYRPRQYRQEGFPLAPFSTRRKYLWVRGVALASGRPCLLTAECIHALSALPSTFRKAAYTNSSTSGIAAWTDAEGALCRATLELIERDAFLRHWLPRRPITRIDHDSLPAPARLRVLALEAAGHRVAISQLGERLVPVFSVFLQHRTRPFTAITAAADFDAERALGKALDEAEGRAAHAAAFPAAPLAHSRQVQSTTDVNRFYQTGRFHRLSDFYAAGPPSQGFAEAASADFCRVWNALKARLAKQQLELLVFDITPAGAAIQQGRQPLRVVRAVVPGLLPIWFQHGLQPAGCAAFQHAAGRPRRSPVSAFIHPFT